MVDSTKMTQVECATNAMRKVSEKINEVKREHDDALFLQNVQEPVRHIFIDIINCVNTYRAFVFQK